MVFLAGRQIAHTTPFDCELRLSRYQVRWRRQVRSSVTHGCANTDCNSLLEHTQAPITSESEGLLLVKATTEERELHQAAWLRAEAYHEARQYGRFTRSFIKQFAQQEARNLQRRARLATQSGRQQWVTLVAVEDRCSGNSSSITLAATGLAAGGEALDMPEVDCAASLSSTSSSSDERDGTEGVAVVGTLDIRLATDEQLEAWWKPGGHHCRAAYLSNVAVASHSRGRGVGGRLLTRAKEVAQETFRAQWLLVHVQVDNKAALRLYTKCGFEMVVGPRTQQGSPHTSAGRLLLLQCPL